MENGEQFPAFSQEESICMKIDCAYLATRSHPLFDCPCPILKVVMLKDSSCVSNITK